MFVLCRIVWAVNIALCLLLAAVGIDRWDNLIQAALWTHVWVLAEVVRAYRERAS